MQSNVGRFIKRLHSSAIGKAKTTAPSFKNLPDKFLISATFSGLLTLSNYKTSSSKVGKKVNFLCSVFRNLS